jgi:hypothetical protein
MSQMKEANQRKRRTKSVPVLSATALSLSLTSGASAAISRMKPNPATSAPVSRHLMLTKKKFQTSAWRRSTSSIRRRSARTRRTRGSRAAAPVGAASTSTSHRSIGRSARRTNTNLTTVSRRTCPTLLCRDLPGRKSVCGPLDTLDLFLGVIAERCAATVRSLVGARRSAAPTAIGYKADGTAL